VQLDPVLIAMLRGMEPLEQVMDRVEEQELPKYEPGALQVEPPPHQVPSDVVNSEKMRLVCRIDSGSLSLACTFAPTNRAAGGGCRTDPAPCVAPPWRPSIVDELEDKEKRE
jgi:hypothetical protein